eukprot:5958528-Pleurochrysis_carterae.AAC.2
MPVVGKLRAAHWSAGSDATLPRPTVAPPRRASAAVSAAARRWRSQRTARNDGMSPCESDGRAGAGSHLTPPMSSLTLATKLP